MPRKEAAPPIADRSAKDLERDYALLESLEGYQKLTEEQKNIVRGTLLVQKWSDLPPMEAEYLGIDREKAREHILPKYCHLAVAALETKGLAERVGGNKFFDGDYRPLETLDQVEKLVTDAGFPCVIHVGSKDPMTIDPNYEAAWAGVQHTCLALGRDKQGNIIVWEKDGSGPYSLTPLKVVYALHQNTTHREDEPAPKTFWAARPLRS